MAARSPSPQDDLGSGQNSAPASSAAVPHDYLELSSDEDEGAKRSDSLQRSPQLLAQNQGNSTERSTATTSHPGLHVNAGFHFAPVFNMQGARIGSFSVNVAPGANAASVQFRGGGASGEVPIPFGTKIVDVLEGARGSLWEPPTGAEGGLDPPPPKKAKSLYQQMVSNTNTKVR